MRNAHEVVVLAGLGTAEGTSKQGYCDILRPSLAMRHHLIKGRTRGHFKNKNSELCQ